MLGLSDEQLLLAQQAWQTINAAKGSRGNSGLRESLRTLVNLGVPLDGIVLNEAYLEEANLRNVDLRGAEIAGTKLRGADLRNANLGWVESESKIIRTTDLRGAELQEAVLSGANLPPEWTFLPPVGCAISI
jgi:uncharacterized protein YjbI with pentapeptide repeats